ASDANHDGEVKESSRTESDEDIDRQQLLLMQQHLHESFVIHKPRDIVSGDFYWAQPKEKGLLLASVDCSGHGVPGALLSLLAFNNLNRTVTEFQLQQPHEILDKLNALMAESLHEHQASPGSDTLDVAICLVDQSGQHLHYAGANSSIFVVQSIGMESVNLMDKVSAAAQKVTLPEHPFKLTEVKADKHPIDGLPTKHGFTSHEIDLHAGDSVYFVTRGFANQFGGERGKKFKINRLKQLILFHQDKSMAALKEVLEQTFDEWKGDLEQIDDLCMIGFRIPEGGSGNS
ncbi:MAG: SpoIIE family protein phosphatase, partial [Bacteroidota bacterium]